ncbi:Copper resistance protein C [Arthrobacter sp. Bi83]|uniref:copper resistance CopC family protein n=1 Tax=Arthrobacter sp. Bi83 TaxID=2822353 RepID=UPI001DAA2268|nr:copper resistance CopC family protein [Arthrobacter sp. Bi83]CAH0251166.1 Copper resistance protein C [Arthrobacter sp. Bi83]
MRSTRQLLIAVLGAVAFAAMLFSAGPASAHDAAESSSPAAGATVATPPAKVSVTFNNNPLGLGSQIKVSDASGSDWADGKVEIVDNVASQKLRDGAPAGKYTVVWRVVSSDSHPIEGTFTFTATAGAAGSTAAAPVPTAGTPQPGITPAPDKVPDASEPFPWSLVVFAAVALGLLVTLGVLARRRLVAGSDDEDSGAGDTADSEGEGTGARPGGLSS